MTGAGAGELIAAKTDGFLGSLLDDDSDGNDDYFEPGVDPNLSEPPSLDRDTSQYRDPEEVFHDRSVAGNLEGSFGVDFVVEESRIDDVHDILFNAHSTSGDILDPGVPATSRWYTGVDYISGVAERALLGCVPADVSIEYNQGEGTRYNVTFLYADEETNASFTPTNVKEATGETVQFHSTELSLDGTVQSKEQSATLTISDISRLQYGSGAVAEDATIADPTASLDMETILTEADQLELAYGGTEQTSTSDRMDAVDASLTLSAAGNTVADFSLSSLKPENYDWNAVIEAETDMTESYTMQVNGVSLA